MKTTAKMCFIAYLILISLILIPKPDCYGWGRYKAAGSACNDTIRKPIALTISPLGLIAGKYSKLKLRLQVATKNRFAIGSDFKLYFNEYSGFQVNPFLKFFVTPDNTRGVYFYGAGLYGMNKKLPTDKNKNYSCYGAGAGMGVQLLIGKNKGGLIDIGIGLKYVVTDASIDINHVPNAYDDFFTIGPAAIVDSHLSIGFRF